MALDAVFLDFYGTISAGDHQAVHDACALVVQEAGLSMPPEEFAVRWGEIFFDLISTSNGAAFQTLHECEKRSLLKALEDLHISPTVIESAVGILKRYWQSPDLHEDSLAALGRLGVPICVVSNADREDIDAAVALHGLRFEAVVTSECARSYKPHGRIFKMALETMGVAPERVIHVGDSLHSDVGGAKAAGIRSVWIQRTIRIHDIGRSAPHHTIRSLLELPDLVDILTGPLPPNSDRV